MCHDLAHEKFSHEKTRFVERREKILMKSACKQAELFILCVAFIHHRLKHHFYNDTIWLRKTKRDARKRIHFESEVTWDSSALQIFSLPQSNRIIPNWCNSLHFSFLVSNWNFQKFGRAFTFAF